MAMSSNRDRERERQPEPELSVAELLDHAHIEANRARTLLDLMLKQPHGVDYTDIEPYLRHLQEDIAHVYNTRLEKVKPLTRVEGMPHRGFDGDSWHEKALTLTHSAEQVAHWLGRAKNLPSNGRHLKYMLKKLCSAADTVVVELEDMDIVAEERQADDEYDAAKAAKTKK